MYFEKIEIFEKSLLQKYSVNRKGNGRRNGVKMDAEQLLPRVQQLLWASKGREQELIGTKGLNLILRRLGEQGGPHRARFLALEEETNAIEPPVNLGGWEFVRSEGATRVRYTICTDSGGSLPRSFQNLATRTTLPDTVGDLIREGLRRSP